MPSSMHRDGFTRAQHVSPSASQRWSFRGVGVGRPSAGPGDRLATRLDLR
jgi:hypothetical protein